MSKEKKWNPPGTLFKDLETNLKKSLRLLSNIFLNDELSEEICKQIWDLQQEIINDCENVSSELIHVEIREFLKFQSEIDQSDEIFSDIIQLLPIEFLKLHKYCALYQTWNEVYDEFHEISKEKNCFEDYDKIFFKVLGEEKQKIHKSLHFLSLRLSTLFDDHILTPMALPESSGGGNTNYQRLLGLNAKHTYDNIIDKLFDIEKVEILLINLEKYAARIAPKLLFCYETFFAVKYETFKSIPKLAVGYSLQPLRFKQFEDELTSLNNYKNKLLYGNSSTSSGISVEKPIRVKELFKQLRAKHLIKISDADISKLIRLAFEINPKYHNQYPEGIPRFEIQSKDFSIELKTGLKALKVGKYLKGSSKDISVMMNRIFPISGLSQLSIERALRSKISNGV